MPQPKHFTLSQNGHELPVLTPIGSNNTPLPVSEQLNTLLDLWCLASQQSITHIEAQSLAQLDWRLYTSSLIAMQYSPLDLLVTTTDDQTTVIVTYNGQIIKFKTMMPLLLTAIVTLAQAVNWTERDLEIQIKYHWQKGMAHGYVPVETKMQQVKDTLVRLSHHFGRKNRQRYFPKRDDPTCLH